MIEDFSKFQPYILEAEQEGLVTRTFRRLDPLRQQAVIQAILDEATERGPSAVNIKNVARRAGVSVGSLYQYFGERDRMLEFAIQLCVRYVTDTFDQFRQYFTGLSLREALTAYIAGGIEWSQAEAGFIQLFARAAYQGDSGLSDRLVVPIADKLREMVHDILSQAAEHGEIRPDVDLETAVRWVHALTIAAGDTLLLPHLNHYYQIYDPEIPAERTLEALLDLITNGIADGRTTGDAA